MDKNIDTLLYDVRELLNKHEEYENCDICYLLTNKEDIKNSIAVVCDKYGELYEVRLKDKEINELMDWSYNVDEDIFELLENEYEIGFMSIEFHSSVWAGIEDIGIDEYEHKLGLQKYLKYCKDNGITKEAIEKEMDREMPDIMQYFEQKTDYIQIENGQVQMPQEMYKKENEVNYITFCLGYDLLNEMFEKSETSECDRVYDFCNYLARKFIETDYYKNKRYSTYDMLQEWINENKDKIQSEYLYFFGIDDKCIIEIGKRGNTPVALVERNTQYGKEYIIGFYYEINNKKLEWGYGYYYNKDLEKAKQDFEKVKAGGNLADTFSQEKSKKHKERER